MSIYTIVYKYSNGDIVVGESFVSETKAKEFIDKVNKTEHVKHWGYCYYTNTSLNI